MRFKLDLQQRHLVLEELGVTLELHSAARPESSPEVVHLRVRRDVTIPPSTEALVPVRGNELKPEMTIADYLSRVGPNGDLVCSVQAQTLDLESDLTTTIFSPEQLLAEQRMDQQVSPVRAALISGERLSTRRPESAISTGEEPGAARSPTDEVAERRRLLDGMHQKAQLGVRSLVIWERRPRSGPAAETNRTAIGIDPAPPPPRQTHKKRRRRFSDCQPAAMMSGLATKHDPLATGAGPGYQTRPAPERNRTRPPNNKQGPAPERSHQAQPERNHRTRSAPERSPKHDPDETNETKSG
ncbi:hypothetical protein FJT64_012589 [Amphibalanus amphitrite]|uniref:Uncharacterized protein n=1 Tax=Amphibalanus amphitrite TaxID=1232801 RepID=A0A6A4VFD4_AMPAM|nr:hypothetical protein FJT64_012589 [Amphibalanus amphitrite]